MREPASKHQAEAGAKSEDGFDFSALSRGESEVIETEQSSAGFAESFVRGACGTGDRR